MTDTEQDQNPKRRTLKRLVEQELDLGSLDWQDTNHYGGSSTAALPGGYYISVIVEIGPEHRHWAVLDEKFTQQLTIEAYKQLASSTNR